MLGLSNWLSGTHPSTQRRTLREYRKAAMAWKRINEKPTSVTFRNAAGATVAAQTLRLEVDNRADVNESAAGAAPRMHVIVYGVRNHETVPNSDIREGYRFVLAGDEYRIVDIIYQLGEIQGIAIATG